MVWEFLHCFGGQEKLRKQNFMTFSIFFLCCMLLFSRSAHSCTTLWPHRLQPARLPCPSLSPGVCSNSCSLNQWCHPTISSSVVPFSSCLQSLTASEFFQWVNTSPKYWSFSFSIIPSKEHPGLISFRMQFFKLSWRSVCVCVCVCVVVCTRSNYAGKHKSLLN